MLILFAVNKQIGMATIDTLINEMFNPVKAFIQFEIFIYLLMDTFYIKYCAFCLPF